MKLFPTAANRTDFRPNLGNEFYKIASGMSALSGLARQFFEILTYQAIDGGVPFRSDSSNSL
jgi:hypothetical protein